ncbi:MAG: sensor histidine kinase [Bacillota bacterium]
MLFSFIILSLLWLLQTVFINTYYKKMKEQNISSAANSISSLYSEVSGIALKTKLDQIANEKDVFIAIMDTSGNAVYYVDPVGRDFISSVQNLSDKYNPNHGQEPQDRLKGISKAIIDNVLRQPGAVFLQNFEDMQQRPMLLYGQVIYSPQSEPAALIISSQLMPLRETVQILSNQLIIITLIILALALGISLIIASRISRPIQRITKTSAQLAAGNYNVVFEQDGYDEINQLAGTLNYASQGLQKVDTLRRELIANVSHDLRTPLTMIKAYAEMIRDISGGSEAKRNAHLGIIIEECDRLASLVQNLLDLSKMQAGAAELHPAAFDIVQKIRDVLTRYAIHSQRDGYRFVFEAAVPAMVYADEERIEQVLYNLLNNAVAHTGEDRRVTVSVQETGARVRVSITDTGAGIPKDHIEHIWDRYYKGGDGNTAADLSHGLGLAIVKAAMLMHGTAFGAKNEYDKGATFWFELQKDTGLLPEGNAE